MLLNMELFLPSRGSSSALFRYHLRKRTELQLRPNEFCKLNSVIFRFGLNRNRYFRYFHIRWVKGGGRTKFLKSTVLCVDHIKL